MFRDSDGYASFFPPEDDIQGHQALLEKHPDLETEDSAVGAISNRDSPDKFNKTEFL